MKNKLIAKLLNCFIATTEKNNLTMATAFDAVKQFNNRRSKNGFTLIELLVVIAIIGVLTSFLLANFIGVKQRARDAQRKSDLRNIQAALEIYRSDKGGYPDSLDCNTTFLDGTTVYMQNVPCDPLAANPPVLPYKYRYTPIPSSKSYTLTACLENTSDSQQDPTNDTAWCVNNTKSFTLKNP